MVRAARQLLSAITKVLILADKVVVKQVIAARNKVLIFLVLPQLSTFWHKQTFCFQNYSINFNLISDGQDELERLHLLEGTITIVHWLVFCASSINTN